MKRIKASIVKLCQGIIKRWGENQPPAQKHPREKLNPLESKIDSLQDRHASLPTKDYLDEGLRSIKDDLTKVLERVTENSGKLHSIEEKLSTIHRDLQLIKVEISKFPTRMREQIMPIFSHIQSGNKDLKELIEKHENSGSKTSSEPPIINPTSIAENIINILEQEKGTQGIVQQEILTIKELLSNLNDSLQNEIFPDIIEELRKIVEKYCSKKEPPKEDKTTTVFNAPIVKLSPPSDHLTFTQYQGFVSDLRAIALKVIEQYPKNEVLSQVIPGVYTWGSNQKWQRWLDPENFISRYSLQSIDQPFTMQKFFITSFPHWKLLIDIQQNACYLNQLDEFKLSDDESNSLNISELYHNLTNLSPIDFQRYYEQVNEVLFDHFRLKVLPIQLGEEFDPYKHVEEATGSSILRLNPKFRILREKMEDGHLFDFIRPGYIHSDGAVLVKARVIPKRPD